MTREFCKCYFAFYTLNNNLKKAEYSAIFAENEKSMKRNPDQLKVKAF